MQNDNFQKQETISLLVQRLINEILRKFFWLNFDFSDLNSQNFAYVMTV